MNNGYPNTVFDTILSKYLDNKSKPPENQQSENNEEIKTHKLYYKNQYSDSYKTDERILQTIIQNNVKQSLSSLP